MVERIRELLAWQQLSPTQFADLIGIGRPVVSHILSERNKPSLDVVQHIGAAFPAVSSRWLVFGIGEMLDAENQDNKAQAVPAPAAVPAAAPQASPPAPAAQPAATAPKPAAIPRQAARWPLRFVAATGPAAPAPVVAATVAPALTAPVAPAFTAPVAPVSVVPPVSAGVAPASVSIVPGVDAVPAPIASAITPETPAIAVSRPVTDPNSAPMPAPELLLPLLVDKKIRRIVIFYQDGSFGDYTPEE